MKRLNVLGHIYLVRYNRTLLTLLVITMQELRWPTLVRSIPGQKKVKGGTLCVWNRKFLFLLWKVLIHEKSLFERIFISRFSSVNKFSIICNEIFKFTTSHGIINFSAYLYLFLSEVLTALYTYLFMFHTINHYIEKIV